LEKLDLIRLAQRIASNFRLDPALICAIIEQESGWHPFVTRYEPAFERRYVDPLGLDWEEDKGRSTSFGLMQIMGEVARELGFKSEFRHLLDIETNLALGCQHFKAKLARANDDVSKALQLWNGGGNPHYAEAVLARLLTYQAQKPPQCTAMASEAS
jgi:soluble lytic murein transglycosylase-like protein